MIVGRLRLRERRIDQVICRGIHTLQKILRIELIVSLEVVDFSVFQPYAPHIFFKFSLIIIPKNQLAGIPGKFGVQPVNDLFQI